MHNIVHEPTNSKRNKRKEFVREWTKDKGFRERSSLKELYIPY